NRRRSARAHRQAGEAAGGDRGHGLGRAAVKPQRHDARLAHDVAVALGQPAGGRRVVDDVVPAECAVRDDGTHDIATEAIADDRVVHLDFAAGLVEDTATAALTVLDQRGVTRQGAILQSCKAVDAAAVVEAAAGDGGGAALGKVLVDGAVVHFHVPLIGNA